MDARVEDVAGLVHLRTSPAFVDRLRAAGSAVDEAALAAYLRGRPDLVEQWVAYAEDQRWTPAAYLDGLETGWYDGGRRDVVRHDDEAAAVADFVRRTAAYLAARG